MKISAILLAAAFIVSPALSFAQSDTSPTYKKCVDESQSNVMGLKECADAEVKRLKKDLANVLKNTASKLSKPRKVALKKSQAAWEKFQGANCDLYIDEEAGQMATIGAYQCSIQMYSTRINELNDIVK